MILVGAQRGGAASLARHLLNDENDHVTVHELRGFTANDLLGALREIEAVSRGTKCRQCMYSLSLNPPADAVVKEDVFEAAIERVEDKLGLSGQPRAVVFHEKEGRRHAHVVWSRIDGAAMKAINLPFTKQKLQQIGRSLFLEHGWKMPHGFAQKSERDPRNFTLAEWQQAKRNGDDPRAIKMALQDAWSISDNRASFAKALEARGFALARGDRRGFVVCDWRGEVYSAPKWIGVKTKEVRQKLGPEQDLPSLDDAKERLGRAMGDTVTRLREEALSDVRETRAAFETKRKALVEKQRSQRRELRNTQMKRQSAETAARQARFRKGLSGLWDRLRGEHGRVKKRNAYEARLCAARDSNERETISVRHLSHRRALNNLYKRDLADIKDSLAMLRRDAREIKTGWRAKSSPSAKHDPSGTRGAATHLPRGSPDNGPHL